MTKNKKWSVFIVLLFFVWGGVSYQWYTCGIKGFCNEQKVVEEADTCGEYLTKHIKLGSDNDAGEVRKLETFLSLHENVNIMVDGIYTKTDEIAVKNFQEKYRRDVLDPWGMARPSGFVYKTTRNKINELYCLARQIK